MGDPRTARMLQFLAPGFLHGLSNALFAIRSYGTLLAQRGAHGACEPGSEPGMAEDPAADLAAIQEAGSRAGDALAIYRLFVEADGDDSHRAAGPLLRELLAQARITLRDRGLRVEVEDAAYETTRSLPARDFAFSLVQALVELDDELPDGFQGRVTVAWDGAEDAPAPALRIRAVPATEAHDAHERIVAIRGSAPR